MVTSSTNQTDIPAASWRVYCVPHSLIVFKHLSLIAVVLTAHLVISSDALADEKIVDLPCLSVCNEQDQQQETEEAIGKIIYKALQNSRHTGEKIIVLGIGQAVDELGYDPQLLREYISEKTAIRYRNGSIKFKGSGLGWEHRDAYTPNLIYKGQLKKDKMAIGFEFRF
ncbi:hypothetical protein [Motiliproteus sp. MSK22-1]|uniref:hypothetical protein n=1 Tax=Motiliproteus sp. MSK22-1 TaxID=1897630 RepID=UPI00097842C3|nr:hypothetical protein [Motiliproteus sp. MSK22-1]OMH30782.1 hypothetical protein BGP75_17290 [Motiliproteus sp. MSK22-1]